MRSLLNASIFLLLATICAASQPEIKTGNCVITGGTNYGLQIQNCTPEPQMILLQPKPGEKYQPIKNPDGTFTYQVFYKIIGPLDFRTVICGPSVLDLMAGPWPAGVAVVTPLTMDKPHCFGEQLSQASGNWVVQIKTSNTTSHFDFRAVVVPPPPPPPPILPPVEPPPPPPGF